MLMDPESAPEGFTRLTFEIAETNGGVCRLTVTHELENAPRSRSWSAAGSRTPAPAAAGRGC
jgi:hypothetical protein